MDTPARCQTGYSPHNTVANPAFNAGCLDRIDSEQRAKHMTLLRTKLDALRDAIFDASRKKVNRAVRGVENSQPTNKSQDSKRSTSEKKRCHDRTSGRRRTAPFPL